MWWQHHLFWIQPVQVPLEEQAALLELCSLPWVLGLGSLLLQGKVQVKQLVTEHPWGRLLLKGSQLVQEPLMEKQQLCCSLHLLLHLLWGLHHLGRLPMEQTFLELVKPAMA